MLKDSTVCRKDELNSVLKDIQFEGYTITHVEEIKGEYGEDAYNIEYDMYEV